MPFAGGGATVTEWKNVTVRWRADNCTVLRRDVKAFANVKTKTKVIKISAPK